MWVGPALLWAYLVGFIAYEDGQKYFRPIRLTVEKYEFEFPGTTSRETVRAAMALGRLAHDELTRSMTCEKSQLALRLGEHHPAL